MKKWNVAAVRAAKGVEKLGCCTAYDACFARLADEAGVPMILIGDSMGMNTLGYATTLPVNMSDTLAATAAVARAVKNALVIGDMPFGSYQCGDDAAVANAVAILKAGAGAVKLEGGASVAGLIRRLTTAGIPVLAHVGMTPQSVNAYGGFKQQGKTREAAEQVLADARAVEEAGGSRSSAFPPNSPPRSPPRLASSPSASAPDPSATPSGSSCTTCWDSTRACRRS